MPTSVQQRRVARFGLFEANLATGELFKNGRRIPLERQPFLVLELLLRQPGEVVARDMLRAALWSDGSFVDFNRGLNVAVRKLRDALSDSAENPRFIETLSRRGYRFIAPLQFSSDAPGASGRELRPRRQRRWLFVSLAAAACAICAAILYWRSSSALSTARASLEVPAKPLTAYLGEERTPALSPDGKQAAFSWNGERQDNSDIYVKFIDSATPMRLTTDPGSDDMPAWSPDGRKIAFVRTTGLPRSKPAIYIVPALGGPERKLAELAPGECYRYGTLSWSPDGEWLAFADKSSDTDAFASYMVSVETGERRKLTSADHGQYGDAVPAFSPDGRALAFLRLQNYANGDIYVVPVAGGKPKRLTYDRAYVTGLSWISDGTELVFSSDRRGGAGIWRIRASGGTPVPLLGIGLSGQPRGLSQKGKRLVFSGEIPDHNIWRVGVQGSRLVNLPTQLIASTRDDCNPQPSPDGQRIAFTSNRSGTYEIWTVDRDGGNSEKLTSTGKGMNSWPTWSPDGTWIAFDSNSTGEWSIKVVSTTGGRTHALSPGFAPSWSRDGKWIYYSSTRGDGVQIWRIPPKGGRPEQVTRKGGVRPAIAPDGKRIYYARNDSVWSVSAKGGDEVLVLNGVPDAEFAHWVPTRYGLYFLAQERGKAVLKFFDFRTRSISNIMPVEKAWDAAALAASSDGRWLFFDQLDYSGSDLMVVDNFR